MKTIQNKTKYMLNIEANMKEPLEECLRIMYVDMGMHPNDMCIRLGITYCTLLNWLEKAGIYSRKLEF